MTLQEVLASPTPDWSGIEFEEIRRAVSRKTDQFRSLRRRRAPSVDDAQASAALAEQIKLLLEVMARKAAERGPEHLAGVIEKLELRMAKPNHLNPFDDIYLAHLRRAVSGANGRGRKE